MAGTSARIIRGCAGFALMAWGYSYYVYPANMILIGAGTVILLAALFNFNLLATFFGYPLMGGKTVQKYGEIDGIPGEDVKGVTPVSKGNVTDAPNETAHPPRDTRGTTQGGSNYGQGSMHLGGSAYTQGSTKTEGSNYKNEEGFDAK